MRFRAFALLSCVAASVSCKPRQSASEAASYQSISRGGKILLWFANEQNVYVKICEKTVPKDTKLTSVEQWQSACPSIPEDKGGMAPVTMSREEFRITAASLFSDKVLFLPKLTDQTREIAESYAAATGGDPKRFGDGQEKLRQLSATLDETTKALSAEQAKLQDHQATADTAVQAIDPTKEKAAPEDLIALYGGMIVELQQRIEDLKTKVQDLAEQREAAEVAVAAVRAKVQQLTTAFEGRFDQFMKTLLDPKVNTVSVLDKALDFEFAVLESVAQRKGLLGDTSPKLVADASVILGHYTKNFDKLVVLDRLVPLKWSEQEKKGCNIKGKGSANDFVPYPSFNSLNADSNGCAVYTHGKLGKSKVFGDGSTYFTIDDKTSPLFVLVATKVAMPDFFLAGSTEDEVTAKVTSSVADVSAAGVKGKVYVRNIAHASWTLAMVTLIVNPGNDLVFQPYVEHPKHFAAKFEKIGEAPLFIYVVVSRAGNAPITAAEVKALGERLLTKAAGG